MRIFRLSQCPVLAAALALTSLAGAQTWAPAAGPLVLLLPVSTRAIGLGNATIRDDYSIFYNPSRISPSSGIGGTFARYDANGTFGALASTVNVGPLNYGWGVELVQFRANSASHYPYVPADLAAEAGNRSVLSFAAVAAAQYVYKGFSTGLGVKFTEDRVDATAALIGTPVVIPAYQRNLLLIDAGVSHALLGGTAEFAVQNIGDRSKYPVPTTAKLGWGRTINTDQLDFVVAGEVYDRQGWVGGGGGAEVGWGWIEGFSAALRTGIQRPISDRQFPVTLGGSLNADRLSVDYALEFFNTTGGGDNTRLAHHLTIRWR